MRIAVVPALVFMLAECCIPNLGMVNENQS